MATYKVLQDIEAEDKFLGPLTLKQFIFALIFAACAYLSFFTLTRGVWFVIVILSPVMFVSGFLGFPWGRDQPTEVWLLARLRFLLKPRRRVWNQDGVQELVTITAPKKVEKQLTKNLSQTEVKSRLKALADTLDSRGWAVKNVNINMYAQPSLLAASQQTTSERLIDLSSLPMNVPSYDISASDDMMDEVNNPVAQQLDAMIKTSAKEYRQRLVESMKTAANPAAAPAQNPQSNYWFAQEPPVARAPKYATFGDQIVAPGSENPIPKHDPSPEELAQLAKIQEQKAAEPSSFNNMHRVLPLSEQQALAEQRMKAAKKPAEPMTPPPDPAILNLAKSNELYVDTVARHANQARKKDLPENGDEVVIPLH